MIKSSLHQGTCRLSTENRSYKNCPAAADVQTEDVQNHDPAVVKAIVTDFATLW